MPFQKYLIYKIIVIGTFCLGMIQVHGECVSRAEILEDSIVKMHGFIYDTVSEGSKKIAVHARLIIESLPFGSEIGIISSDDSSGYYEYQVNLNHRYSVDIQSEIHEKHSEEIDPMDIVTNGEITKNFYLQPEIKEKQVIRLQRLIFEQGSARITADSYGELDYIVKTMHQNPSMEIRLEGHTDIKGSKKLNMELSKERVEAVKLYLTVKGISSNRIKTKAFGGSQPLVTDGSAEASRLNRRVEVRILKL